LNYFYINSDNQAEGPIGLDQLHMLFQQGIITSETGFALEGTSEWIPYRQLLLSHSIAIPVVISSPAPNEGFAANHKTPRKLILAGWLMIGVTCLVALIPGIGFLTWLIAAPILLVTFILGILGVNKGATTQGILILLASLIAAPVFLFFAPILSTAVAVSGAGVAAASSEVPCHPGWVSEVHESKSKTELSTGETPIELTKPTISHKGNSFLMGETVLFNDSSWVVVSATELGSNLLGGTFRPSKKSEGKFILVQYKVTNLTNEEEQILFSPAVRDSKGRKFEELDESEMYLPNGEMGITMEALPSSLPKTFSAIFEVAGDSENFVFLTRSFAPMRTEEKPVVLEFKSKAVHREIPIISDVNTEKTVDAAIEEQSRKLRESELALKKVSAEQESKQKLAEFKGELAAIVAKMDSERVRYQAGIDTINRLTNFKRNPVQEGSQPYYQCLEASKVVKEVEAGVAELKAGKARLEATIAEFEK
jgi:hypothetical protein